MKITKEQILALEPCEDGLDWYIKNGTEDLLETLIRVNEYKPEYARWLFTRLMNKTQLRKIAIFSAIQVLPIFEEKYPEDDRPRKAIEAAKRVLEVDNEETRYNAAAHSAYAAAHSTYVAADSAADHAADHAADSAADAATTASADAYDAADSADAAAYAAAHSTYASAHSTYVAADLAAYAAAHSAHSTYVAPALADSAAAYAASKRKEMQILIINEAVRILEKE